MPTMTMTQKAYRELEQAAQMSGATKDIVLENALSRYLAELQEDAENARLKEPLIKARRAFNSGSSCFLKLP